MRILSIGEDIVEKRVSTDSYGSALSFLDFDVLLWNPNGLFDNYEAQYGYPTYHGYRSLSDNDSAKLIEDVTRRKSEIAELINLGRVVCVFLPPPQKCFYATGERTYSGTGRSRVTTRHVNELGLLSTIPVKGISTTLAEGDNIEFRGGEPFKSFWGKVKGFHYYSAYLSTPIGKPFLFVKGTQKVVGTWIPSEKGVLLLLPPFYMQEYYNTKKDYSTACTTFVDSLTNLSNELKKATGDYALPDWTKGFLLPGEDNQHKEIQQRESKLKRLVLEISSLKEGLGGIEKYKILFSGSGRALEVQVTSALTEIGFDVEERGQGRDDLVLKYKGRTAVAEIKGVSKSAAEKHAAQLEKWVSEYLTDNDVNPKGILIVNAFNETPLEARSEPSFPSQMITYSVNRGHCLITTIQLLGVLLYLREHPDRRDEIVSGLLDTNGVYPQFSDYRQFLSSPKLLPQSGDKEESK